MAGARVLGAAVTAFGKIDGRTLRSLAAEAVRDALADAGLQVRDVGLVFFANAADGLISGQEMIRGQSALRHTGLLGTPIFNVENACASATSAFLLACMAVESGAVDVALAVGAEKLTHSDKARPWQRSGRQSTCRSLRRSTVASRAMSSPRDRSPTSWMCTQRWRRTTCVRPAPRRRTSRTWR